MTEDGGLESRLIVNDGDRERDRDAEEDAAGLLRCDCKQIGAFMAFHAVRLFFLAACFLVVLLTNVAGSGRGAVALLVSITVLEVFEGSIGVLEYIQKRGWARDTWVRALTVRTLLPAVGILVALPVCLVESGAATGIDSLEAYTMLGLFVLNVLTGGTVHMFGSRANDEARRQWRQAIEHARAERLVSDADCNRMLRFDQSSADTRQCFNLLSATTLSVYTASWVAATLIALTPCFARVSQGGSCGGDGWWSRLVVGMSSVVTGGLFAGGSVGAVLLHSNVQHFRFVARVVRRVVQGDAVNSAQGLLQLHAFLVHFHRWMAATVRGLAVPFVWFALCAAVLTVLLSLCYLVPAFLPFLFAHWPVLLMVACLVGLLDLFVIVFLYRASAVNHCLEHAVQRLADNTLIDQARYIGAAAASDGKRASSSDAKAPPVGAAGSLAPALAQRDSRELAFLGLVLTYWSTANKGVTLAGVHLRRGLFRSALLAVALQGLAFLIRLAASAK